VAEKLSLARIFVIVPRLRAITSSGKRVAADQQAISSIAAQDRFAP
jgi:hypothetical protein